MSTFALSAEAAPQPRSRIAAALLSLLAPGVGHLYVGRRRRALVFMSVQLVIGVLCIVLAVLVPREIKPVAIVTVGLLLLTLLYWLCAMIDAVRLARRADAAPPVRWHVLVAAVLAFWAATTALDAATPSVHVSAQWKCQGALGDLHDCVRVS